MLRNISVTLFTRILVTLAGFFAVVLNARVTGAEGVGTIGLIVLAISMIQLLNNMVGGGSLIYLVSRVETGILLLLAYIWSIITAFVGAYILSIFQLIPEGFEWHVVYLSILQSVVSINLSLLVGKEKFNLYNILSIIQYILLLSILLCLYFVMHNKNILSYLYSLYISYSVIYVLSIFYLKPELTTFSRDKIGIVLKEMLGFGIYVQMASIFQLLSSRLSYYFIEIFLNRASLGIFTVGTQLSESIWLVGKSIATIQYSRIASSNDRDYAVRITILFVKFSFVVSLVLLFALLLLPNYVFTFIFSTDFIGVREIIAALFLGTLSVSVSVIFSHYFSGIGNPKYNMIASAIGCFVTLVSGYILVPKFGLIGAGIAVSLASMSAVLFQAIVFVRSTQIALKAFLINRNDLQLIKDEWARLLAKK